MAMRYLIWLCIFQYFIFDSFAQSLDSLRLRFAEAQASKNVIEIQKYSSQLAWVFFGRAQYDSSLKYYHKSIASIAPGREASLVGNLMIGLGAIYSAKGEFDSSVFYYRSALVQFQHAKDTTNELIAESNLSIIYKNIGLYEESLEAALYVVSSFRTSDNSILKGSCYNTLGSVYTRIREYDKALEFYRLALENRKQNNQPADVARILNNLGELFILTKEYDSAAASLQQSAEIKRKLSDTKGLARTVNNIGKVSMLTGDVIMAEKHFNNAIAIQNTVDDPVGMIEVLNNLGELSLIIKQLNEAERVLTEGEKLIRRTGTPDHLRQNLELQVRLDRERRDYASGMLHLEQLSAIRDSLINQEKNRSMQAMQIRYETQKKEQQIALLEQQEEINKNRIRNNQILIGGLVLGLVLVAAVGLLTYINFRNARSARQKFELLLADTRHRIKNNLQTLASIFNLQTRYFTDNNMILEARSSESRVHAMSLLHQKFYSVDPGHTIDLRPCIADLVDKLVDIYGFRTKNLSLQVDVDDVRLDIDKALPLSLIIQELASNAFKYAFDREPDPKLLVEAKLQSNGELQTTIADNGSGVDIGKTRSSQGFNLVDAFIAQLDGNLQVKTEKGTIFIIRFPITPLWKKRSF